MSPISNEANHVILKRLELGGSRSFIWIHFLKLLSMTGLEYGVEAFNHHHRYVCVCSWVNKGNL